MAFLKMIHREFKKMKFDNKNALIISKAAKFNFVFVHISSFTNKTYFPGALQTRVREGSLL